MYLCSLIVDKQNGIEMVKGEGYIGIKLNKNNKNNSFEIFYIGGQYE